MCSPLVSCHPRVKVRVGTPGRPGLVSVASPAPRVSAERCLTFLGRGLAGSHLSDLISLRSPAEPGDDGRTGTTCCPRRLTARPVADLVGTGVTYTGLPGDAVDSPGSVLGHPGPHAPLSILVSAHSNPARKPAPPTPRESRCFLYSARAAQDLAKPEDPAFPVTSLSQPQGGHLSHGGHTPCF